MSKTLGLSRRAWLLFLHYLMLAAALTFYYGYVNPPDASKTIFNMYAELTVLLIVADLTIHKIVGVD